MKGIWKRAGKVRPLIDLVIFFSFHKVSSFSLSLLLKNIVGFMPEKKIFKFNLQLMILFFKGPDV